MDYAAKRRRAGAQIARAGQPAVLLVRVAAEDPDEPWRGGTEDREEVACTVAVIGFTKNEFGEVQAGDKRALISAQGLATVPTPAMELSIGGEVHQIVRVDPVSPAGTDIVYDAFLRSRRG